MSRGEFAEWLEALVASGRIDEEQARDLLRQRDIFDEVRTDLESEYTIGDGPTRDGEKLDRGGVVMGYQHGEQLRANTVPELLAQAHKRSNYWLVYFEPIGFSPFGSAYGDSGPA